MEGKYRITVKVGDKLIYSFIGMQDETRVVGASIVINVKLNSRSQTLEEVVVQGYASEGNYSSNYKGKSVKDKKAKPTKANYFS